MAQSNWFLGPRLHEPRQAEFIEALTRAAEEGALADVDPAQTLSVSLDHGSGVVVGFEVPGLSCDRKLLEVTYEPRGEHGLPVLTSAWTAGVTPHTDLDDYEGPSDDGALWVSGIEATSAQCAAWAMAWWSRQRRRPVTRREWDQPTSGFGSSVLGRQRESVAVEWRLENPEQELTVAEL